VVQIFQGTAVPGVTPGLAASAQYLQGRQRFNDQTFVGFGPIFPFTLAIAKNFEYAYANQANFAVERQLGKDLSLSASWIYVGAHHLPHPQDVNSTRVDLLLENFRRFSANNPVLCPAPNPCPNGRAPLSYAEATFFPMPTATSALYTVVIPGMIAVNNTSGQRIISPVIANYFRPSAPNYFFAQANSGGAVTPAVLNAQLVGTVRTPGAISPFGDVSAQLSDGDSTYNAMNIELKKRMSNNFQFLASWTWSHSIDDSSDLQTLLKPQDNYNFKQDRSDSLFDQRHRFVLSGLWTSPAAWRGGDTGAKKFFADFVVAPIIEISSGRPFNILTGTDRNGDQQGSNERPSVDSSGALVLPAFFTNGSLGRNRGTTHGFATFDLRVARTVRLGERVRLEIITEGFNLFNRFNEAAASPFFTDVNAFAQRAPGGRYYSRPTAAFDPRQFQFGLKLNF
jgi:hypothetical protein